MPLRSPPSSSPRPSGVLLTGTLDAVTVSRCRVSAPIGVEAAPYARFLVPLALSLRPRAGLAVRGLTLTGNELAPPPAGDAGCASDAGSGSDVDAGSGAGFVSGASAGSESAASRAPPSGRSEAVSSSSASPAGGQIIPRARIWRILRGLKFEVQHLNLR